jgi:dTMP kinase
MSEMELNTINKKFISFEGIDFSGKSTQIKMLKEYLEQNGQSVYVLREPGGTEISERIREILLDKEHMHLHPRAEMLLFSAARAQVTNEKIIPLLQNGEFVIADRFVDSTTAYQGFGRNLEQEMINHVNKFATFGLLPSKTFYLDIDPEAAFSRKENRGQEADRLEEAGLDFFKKVTAGYRKLAKMQPNRFVILDAAQVVEDIHRLIIKRIYHLFNGEVDEKK